MNNNECLICGEALEYLTSDVIMSCEICGKEEKGKTSCIKGHYVCDECHAKGMDVILNLCMLEDSKNPIEIFEKIIKEPFCHMHGPEHHVIVGAVLLTAYKNAGGDIDLKEALQEMMNRGKSVPGGACGFWGAYGAGISSGIFVSIISGSTPLNKEAFALPHKMTSRAMNSIAEVGGPRCCKRSSYLSIAEAVDFVKENFGVEMVSSHVRCIHSHDNNQCIENECPFFG